MTDDQADRLEHPASRLTTPGPTGGAKPAPTAVRRPSPDPEEVLNADSEMMHDAGLSRRKLQTIHALAAESAEHRITDDALRETSGLEIEAQLTAIPGIGPWTVHGFSIIALDRPDVVAPGDLALRKAIRRAYGLDHLPSQDEVLGIAEAWRLCRTLASAYLFATAFD